MHAIAPARRRRTAFAVLAAVVALGGAACGQLGPEPASKGAKSSASSKGAKENAKDKKAAEPFAGLSGPEIANRAARATKAATSLTLDITMKSADGPTKGFMAISTKGDCKGTLSVGSDGTVELIKTGNTAYMRFDEAFLREQSKGEPAAEADAVIKTLKGRWMRTDVSDPEAKDSLELCDLDSVLSELEANDNAARRAGETTVNGQKALKLTESDGEATYTLYVATEGEPYLLKVEQVGGEEPGTMTFSAYNKPVAAKKPAAKDILDLDKLGEQ
ncbi:hypothetical protein ACH492_14940 [Streptomyces sp. NPDC019443]|uniref:hypothetical protein n=1 Tax=Streptomyces sp. NPDC019443 TaxID=3365061 RepID=UPI00379B4CBD